MKVKAAPPKAKEEAIIKKTVPTKVNMDRVQDELFKLGFTGGQTNRAGSKVKAKLEFLFIKRTHSDLIQVNSIKKVKKGEVNSRTLGMRLKGEDEFSLDVVLVTKTGELTWDYSTAAQDKLAKGRSGMHSKLVKIFGKQNG